MVYVKFQAITVSPCSYQLNSHFFVTNDADPIVLGKWYVNSTLSAHSKPAQFTFGSSIYVPEYETASGARRFCVDNWPI